MKRTLAILLAGLLPLTVLAEPPKAKPAPPQSLMLTECFIAIVIVGGVLFTGGCAYVSLKKWCKEHLGTNAPPATNPPAITTNDIRAAVELIGIPLCVPPLSIMEAGPEAMILQGSSNMQTWEEQYTCRFSPAPGMVTITISKAGQDVATRTVPIVDGRAFAFFSEVQVQEPQPAGYFRLLSAGQ